LEEESKRNTTNQMVNGQLLYTVIVRVADAATTSERRPAKCLLNILDGIHQGFVRYRTSRREVERIYIIITAGL
jgi:hypothetical protein